MEYGCQVLINEGHNNLTLSIKDDLKKDWDPEVYHAKLRKHDTYQRTISTEADANYTPLVEEIILAKEWDGGEYLRAKVVEVQQNEAKVFFVDTGVHRRILKSDFRKIPSELLSMSPALAIPCCLTPSRILTDNTCTKAILQTILKNAVNLKVIFRKRVTEKNGCKKWEVSLKFRETVAGRWISLRGEVQRVLAKRNQFKLNDSDDSDDAEEIFNYYMSC